MNCPLCREQNPEGTKYCLACGAPLAETAATPPPPAQPIPRNLPQQQVALKTSGLAIAALVLGILGFCTAGLTGLIGLILGIIALVQIGDKRHQLQGSGLAIAGITVSAVALPTMILAAIVFPVFARARSKARETVCMNNVRQQVVAIQMYMQDHQNAFPSENMWQEVSFSPDCLVCPAYGRAHGNAYGYNANLVGKSITSLSAAPSEYIVTADSSNSSHLITSTSDIDFRHFDKAVTGYADGHVTMLGATDNPQLMP